MEKEKKKKKETNILRNSGYVLGRVQCTSQKGGFHETQLGPEPKTHLTQSDCKRQKEMGKSYNANAN